MSLIKAAGNIHVIDPARGDEYDWVVGSKSNQKVDPYAQYLASRGWNETLAICPASSAGSEQPRFSVDGRRVRTQEQIGRCCLNRLLHSMALRPHAKKGWLALENGIVRLTDFDAEDRSVDGFTPSHDIDFCVLYLQTVDGARTAHFSSGLEVPEGALDASEASGYTETAGTFVAQMLGTPDHPVDRQDWHAAVTTNNIGTVEMSRRQALFNAIRELYGRHEAKQRQKPLVDTWNAARRMSRARG